MINFARIGTLSFVSFVLVSGLAASTKLDNNGWPVSIAPTSSTVYPGNSVGFTAAMNQGGSTPTTITISSSNPSVLSVPSTVTVPAGDTAVYFTGTTPVIFDQAKAKAQAPRGTQVTITVSANGRSAQTNVTVQ